MNYTGKNKNTAHPSITPELLRAPDVMAITGIKSATQLRRLRKEGIFPSAVRIGKRDIAWRRADIDKWIEGLPEAPVGTMPI